MLHKHHSTHQLLGFLLAVVAIGGAVGSVTGLMGKALVHDADALRINGHALSEDIRLEHLQDRMEQRFLRRKKRLQKSERVVSDIDVTYPMHVSTLDRHLNQKWDVSLNTGMLSYSRFGIRAPIGKPSITNWKNRDWKSLENQMQFGLLNGVVAYPHSSNPGQAGKMIVAGHSSAPNLEVMGNPYEDVFAPIPDAEIGDIIQVQDGNGGVHAYRVRESREIPATYTSILLQDKEKDELILFTCYPVGTTRNRWAVTAELVEENLAMQ